MTKNKIKNQETLGNYFIKKLGKLVEQTYKKGKTINLSKQDCKEVIKTTFHLLGKQNLE